ncbi:hypothetical protein ABW21_db0201849 [Orbilia brochopaga]|nr:hypothetical protein ABW21_db0201849 [Drechslerella brochopaga]
MVGARKRILLLEGGIQALNEYLGNKEAQIKYRADRDRIEREREERERLVREQEYEAARKRIEDDLIAAGNTDYLNLPDSPEITIDRSIPSGLQNISPQNRLLILGQHHSNIPLEEEDREATMQLDGEILLRHLQSDPAPQTGCSRRGGRALGDDPFGDNEGGGLRKRDLGFLNGSSKPAVLQGQKWGILKPEKRGKGMRVVKRM